MADQTPEPDPTSPESATPENAPPADSAPEPAPEPAGAPDDGGPSIDEMAEEALESVSQAAAALSAEISPGAGPAGPAPDAQPSKPDLPRFDAPGGADDAGAGLSLLDDVDLKVKVELGRTRMYIEDVLRLDTDSVVELDKAAGDPVDIYVNDRHIARGEILVLEDNFCVRVSEILEPVGEKKAQD